jgi:hypothetical protein
MTTGTSLAHRTSRAERLWALVVVLIAVSAAPARALPQFVWDEHSASSGASLGTFPYDCATSHNNNRAAVRYANPSSNATIVTIWNLVTAGVTPIPVHTIGGGGVKSGVGTMLGFSPFTNYMPSDRIDLTNSVGVSIGAGESPFIPMSGALDESYIEVFDFAPPGIRFQHVQAPASSVDWENLRAGFAHDVAITRDGDWAVVNSANWIHVLNLNFTLPSAARVQSFNIGRFDYSGPTPVVWDRPCTPNRAVDSVEVTNDRAVVTTARWNDDLGGYTTWVYIIDLTDPMMTGMASIVLQHEILPPPGTVFPTEFGDWPHDLTVTPHTDVEAGGGQVLAVVTTMHSIAAYNLGTNTFLNSFYDGTIRREYQWQVDSIELTGKVAVAISGDFSATPRWRIEFFAVTSPPGLAPLAMYTAPLGDPDRAHDLAIEKDHDKGLVRTSRHNVVLTSLTSPPPAPIALPPIVSPNGSDAHAYQAFQQPWFYTAFSSDSVAIGTLQVENGQNRLMAVSIGAMRVSASVWEGAVDVIDLLAAAPTVLSQVRIVSNSTQFGGCVPLDLSIASSQTEVVVRSADPNPEAPTTSMGADLARVRILPTTAIGLIHGYGGNGSTMGLDSLAAPPLTGFINTTRRILSIAQDASSLPSGVDYIHIAR